MTVDQHNPDRSREVERLQFEAALRRLENSGAPHFLIVASQFVGAGGFSQSVGFEPGMSPEATLEGPTSVSNTGPRELPNGQVVETEETTSIDFTVVALPFLSDGLSLRCSRGGVRTEMDKDANIKEIPFSSVLWGMDIPHSHKPRILEYVRSGIERSGLVQKDKAEEFKTTFDALQSQYPNI
ncbi:MAG: hypothetical protein AAB907_01065 [Patescibacteria group bacterium]